VSAQNENSLRCCQKKEVFCFGPKVSVSFTQDDFFHFSTQEYVPGADLGLFFRFKIARLYFQPEINYVMRNHFIDFHEIKNETHYIGLPLLAGVRVVDCRFFKLRFFAGPEFNFALRYSSFNYFQLGVHAGLGIDLWRFAIDAGYSFLAYTGWKNLSSDIFKVGIGFKCY
jgi:hypothetical protein